MLLSSKVEIFKKLFRGRTDCYGLSEGRTVKEYLSDNVIKKHIEGKIHLGRHPLNKDNMTHWVVIDIDSDDIESAFKYKEIAKRYSINAYVETSKSKGFHVWIFFQEPIEAIFSRRLAKKLLVESELPNTIEIYPKQDEIFEGVGNYINLPLCGQLIEKNKTIFIEQGYGKDRQWELMKFIATTNDYSTRITRKHLLSVIDNEPIREIKQSKTVKNNQMLPCFEEFSNGVSSGARDIVSIVYSEHLRRKGLPLQQAIELLEQWNEKNNPPFKGQELNKLMDNVKRVYSGDQRLNNFRCDDPIMQQFCKGKDNCPVFKNKVESTSLEKLIDECKEKAFNSINFRGIYFGFTKLDDVMDGLQFHNSYFIGAKTNVGKTSFCLNIAREILIKEMNVKVLYFSLDDNETVIIQRLIALSSGLTIPEVEKFDTKVLQSMLNDDEKAAKSNKLSKAFEDLKKYKDRFKLYGIEQISAIDDIERIIDHEAKGYKLIVFIDMLHSVKDHNYSKNDRRYQLIELSRRIKILKSKYILAFFSVVEIRKSAKEGKEGLELEDIAETAKIGYDANAIFLMEEIPQVDGNVEENKAIIKLRVAKNKTSSFKGIIEYEFYTNRALFKEIL